MPPSLVREDVEAKLVALAGRTLGELAKELALTDLSLHKGAVGQWIERAVGLVPNNRKGPDVDGLEIKTLPIRDGKVAESTYVTTLPHQTPWPAWRDSHVAKKLAAFVFVPIQSESEQPLLSRKIGTPIFVDTTHVYASDLADDWDRLHELATVHGYDGFTAHHGTWLQVRPKAAHGKTRALRMNEDGNFESVQPRGFYLRSRFAMRIIQDAALRA